MDWFQEMERQIVSVSFNEFLFIFRCYVKSLVGWTFDINIQLIRQFVVVVFFSLSNNITWLCHRNGTWTISEQQQCGVGIMIEMDSM